MLTGRVTEANAKTLKSWADEAGLPMYQAVVRALEVGISSLTKGYDHNLSTAEAGKLIDMPRLDIQALVQSMRRLADNAVVTSYLLEKASKAEWPTDSPVDS